MRENQYKIIWSSPRYATRTKTFRATLELARLRAISDMLADPADAETRAVVYQRTTRGFQPVATYRTIAGRIVATAD